MRRREFIAVLGGAAVTWRLSTHAEAAPVIGFLSSIKPYPALLQEFQSGLAENGYYEGRNVTIQYRSAEGNYERLPALAAELVQLRVDVIVAAGGTISARMAKAATNSIPIVFLGGGDPVRAGLAASLSHPGGNVTGVAQLTSAVEGKRLEFLRELLPKAETLGYLVNPALAGADLQIREVELEAQALKVKLFVLKASNEPEIDNAFATIAKERIGGISVAADPLFFAERGQLVALAERHAVPTIYFFREFASAGGLISYGTNLTDAYRRIATYTARILAGARPADLPITQLSEKIELVINLKTAKGLRLDVPQALLARADEVIE
jgi:putative tryptophan/tyrosine transport system substrate-binding protein